MKISISTIAWDVTDDRAVAELLKKSGVTAIEIVPSRFNWESPTSTAESCVALRAGWHAQGIQTVAMQGLLFGYSSLQLFSDKQSRTQMAQRLRELMIVGRTVGVRRYIFGSPRNRLRGKLNDLDAFNIASEFFSEIGDYALENDACLCIEANPKEYDCDFLTNTQQAGEFIVKLNHAGIALNFDTGCVMTEHENALSLIDQFFVKIKHVHLSAPSLSPLGDYYQNGELIPIIRKLSEMKYQDYISIEMKQASPVMESISAALDATKIPA